MDRKYMKIILSIVVLFLQPAFLGCQTSKFHLPGGYTILEEPPSTWEALSDEFIIFADNQTSNLYSLPIYPFRSVILDKMVNVTVRPAQLDYFAKDILTEVVFPFASSRGKSPRPMIHLGDACNFSCTGEFEKFLKIMDGYKGQWVMIPGNHDVSLLGNLTEAAFNPQWDDACNKMGSPLKKDKFIARYLIALASRTGEEYAGLRRQLGITIADNGYVDIVKAEEAILKNFKIGEYRTPGKGAYAHAIVWEIDTVHPLESFIVQRIDMGCNVPRAASTKGSQMSCVQAVLFDTTNYKEPVTDTAISGDIQDRQFQAVERFAIPPDTIVIFMGHHPYAKLGFNPLLPDTWSKKTVTNSQRQLNVLRRKMKALTYVSADIHLGQYFTHQFEAPGSAPDTWFELNLGSVTDWPAEIRTLQIFKSGNQAVLSSPRYSIADLLNKEGIPANTHDWEIKPDEEDFYIKYRKLESVWDSDYMKGLKLEMLMKDLQLRNHKRLITLFPTVALGTMSCPVKGVDTPIQCDSESLKKIDALLAAGSAGQAKNNDPTVNELSDRIYFLEKLENYDQTRSVNNAGQMRKYRLSQAYWASKYEYFKLRMPDVNDQYIALPLSLQ